MPDLKEIEEKLQTLAEATQLQKETIDIQKKNIDALKLENSKDKSLFEKYFTPVTGPIYVAIIGAVVSLLSLISKQKAEITLSSIKNEQAIVINALSKKDIKQTSTYLQFAAVAGLLEHKDSVLAAINNGTIANIINPFQVDNPKRGDTLYCGKTFEISGTTGSNDNKNIFVLLKDATIIMPNAYYYPIHGITFSTNGKWFTNAISYLRGPVLILLVKANETLSDSLNKACNNSGNSAGININESSFQILDYVKVSIENPAVNSVKK